VGHCRRDDEIENLQEPSLTLRLTRGSGGEKVHVKGVQMRQMQWGTANKTMKQRRLHRVG